MALQSIFDIVSLLYISKKGEKLLSVRKNYNAQLPQKLLLRHSEARTRFIDLVHCLMKYVMTFMLEYEVQSLQAPAFDIVRDMQSSWFMLDASSPHAVATTPSQTSS